MSRKSAVSLALGGLAFAFAIALSSQAFADPAARALITRAINNNDRVALVGNTHPEATAANDRGAVASSMAMDHMQLLLKRPAEREAALLRYMDDLHNKTSPNFHKWMTAKQFGERYGLAQSDIDTVSRWLSSQGFRVNGVYTNRLMIDFSGNAGQVHTAFGAEIHNIDVGGVKHVANMRDPQVPAALAPAIHGIASLHDFMPRPQISKKFTWTTSGGHTYHAVVPADLATIYNLNPLFTGGTSGQGQTIAAIEDTYVISTADWDSFRSKFGLTAGFPSGSLTLVHPSGPTNCSAPGVNGDDVEAQLDAQWASAAAPNAAIQLASCANTRTQFGGLIAFNNLVNAVSTPAVISVSYGLCEAFQGASQNAFINASYQQAAAEGVSVFVSSGDEDSSSCDRASAATHGIGVSGLASTPYNVAVGGTDYGDTYAHTTATYWSASNTATYGSALSYIPEIPWNNSCASELIAQFVTGSPVTYGAQGFCNSATGKQFLSTAGGSGGPSGCATGKPKTPGVVGGTCAGYPKPSWQTGVTGIPSDGVRDLPDVSLFAANGVWSHYFVFCYSNPSFGGTPCGPDPSRWAGAGGTSFSAPIWAGFQALVNQVHGIQGNPNPVYYSLAAGGYGGGGVANCNSSNGTSQNAGCIFHDVTLGDIIPNCTGTVNCYRPSGKNGVLSTSNSSYQPAWKTTTGYDLATGIGTVNVNNLVNASWP